MTIRDRLIEAVGYEIAIGCGHTLASVSPMKLGPNTERIAESVLDAFLAVLSEHADEWRKAGHLASKDFVTVDLRRLLAVLADPEETP